MPRPLCLWLLLGLLALPLPARAAESCGAECQESQRQALLGLYSGLGGPGWSRQAGWSSSGGGSSACSWEGVECCGAPGTPGGAAAARPCPLPGGVAALDLAANGLAGPWPADSLARLGGSLVRLNLRGNAITGQLPESVGALRHLALLYVDANALAGPLPAALGRLGNLTHLTAGGNALSGPLPAGFAGLRSLQWLLLQDNRIEGPLPEGLLSLPALERLQLQNNRLGGRLPSAAGGGAAPLRAASGPAARPLDELRLSGNELTGGIPPSLAALPAAVIDLSGNRLSGSLPAGALGSNWALTELHLADNQLTGGLDAALFSGNLQVLDVAGNRLRGSLPDLGGAGVLQRADLRGNGFEGRLPSGLPRMKNLQLLDARGNRLEPQDGPPEGLQVDSSAPGAASDPSGDPGLMCHPLTPEGRPDARVLLDPPAYGSAGCYCQAPFEAKGSGAGLSCQPPQAPRGGGPPLAAVLGPLLTVALLALVALACVAAVWRCGLGGIVHRINADPAKKGPPGRTGAAKDVTLVLTDVQGSTELWEWDQQLASEAFKIHDKVLRQYMALFYGYEVSTEGDAFLVAFHEPFDAVAWCLCVQLALHYADWPEQLLLHKSTCIDVADTLEYKRRRRQERWQEHMSKAAGGSAAAATAATAAAAAARGASGGGSYGGSGGGGGGGGEGLDWGGGGGSGGGGDALSPAPLVSAEQYAGEGGGVTSDSWLEERLAAECATTLLAPGSKAIGRGVLFRGLRVRMSAATGSVDAVRIHSVTQRAEYVGEVLRKVQAVGETPQGGQVIMDDETFQGINARLPELGGVVLEATQKLLRTVAGPSAEQIAAMFARPPGAAAAAAAAQGAPHSAPAARMDPHGWMQSGRPSLNLPRDEEEAGGACEAPEAARQQGSGLAPPAAARGGAAARGQAPRGASAAAAVGDGDVGPQEPDTWGGGVLSSPRFPGADDIEMGSASLPGGHPSPRQPRRPKLAQRVGRMLGRGAEEEEEDASSSSSMDVAAGAAASGPGAAGRGSPRGPRGPRAGRRGGGAGGAGAYRRRSSLSYGVMVVDMGVHQLSGLPQKANLVQAMPCGLEDRARFFPRLDSLRQETPGYFDAPAAGLVPLSAGGEAPPGTAVPAVAIVFCTIDKWFEMAEVNRAAAELALELYSDCVRWLLLVGGGYECQEAEGTFMVAFSSADVAIEWCLMVQQVLRDMSWPPSVLELPTCEEERDMHGTVVFRGPRVKMGVYAGTPTRVVPHTTTGRADYFGPLVNRAARYCHAAARGGQVLVPKELICEIVSKWVQIDPLELMQSDQLLEFAAYFDEERRLWPWLFKRRSHWDVALPRLPPYLASFTALGEDSVRRGHQHSSGGGSAAAAAMAAGHGWHPPAAAGMPAWDQAAAVGDTASAAAASAGGMQPDAALGCDQQQQGALLQSRLAPLDELAEAGSRAPSEPSSARAGRAGGPRPPPPRAPPPQQQGAGPALGRPPPAPWADGLLLMPRPPGSGRNVRRHSDLAPGFSRLGPAAMQVLQAQYSLALGQPAQPPQAAQLQLQQQPQMQMQGMQQMQQQRYRRPSYVSDVSAARSSWRLGASDPSASASVASSAVTTGTPWGPVAGPASVGGGGSRRPSALSDFFPEAPAAAGAAAAACPGYGEPSDAAAAGQHPGGQAILQQQQQQLSPPPAPWQQQQLQLQRSSSGSAHGSAGCYGSGQLYSGGQLYGPPPAVLPDAGADVGVPPQYDRSLSQAAATKAAGHPAVWQQQQQRDRGGHHGPPGHAAGSEPGAAGATTGSSGATGSSGVAGGGAGRGGSVGHLPPAAMLLQGLESQVLPGMLHSSNRLRLVSKRRRQMSYCFFQESSKPGNPADGSDPRRLLPPGQGAAQAGGMGAASSPPSHYTGSEAGYSTGAPAGSARLGTLVGSGSGSFVGSGMASGRTSGCGSGDSALASGGDPVGEAPHMRGAATDEPGSAAAAAAAAAPAGAAAPPPPPTSGSDATGTGGAASAGGQPALWGGGGSGSVAGMLEEHCGLPEIEPLPDADVLESLRMAAPRLHRPSNASAMTGTVAGESVTGFQGPGITHMCSDIMRGRWLWIGELLVHDLGQFRFKGVAGVHSIVSVTSEELGGRTFPTTIRRGKGEQVRLGRGLLALVQMLPRPKTSAWTQAYAGQQLLQSPLTRLSGQEHVLAGPPAVGAVGALGQLDGARFPIPVSVGGWAGAALAEQQQHQPPWAPGRMVRSGSFGSLRAAVPMAAGGAATQVLLLHHSSAPEASVAAAAVDASGGAGAGTAGPPAPQAAVGAQSLHPRLEQEQRLQQRWIAQQQVWWQHVQQRVQQQRQRRHSVCLGSVMQMRQGRLQGGRPQLYDMQPFDEADEWPGQAQAAQHEQQQQQPGTTPDLAAAGGHHLQRGGIQGNGSAVSGLRPSASSPDVAGAGVGGGAAPHEPTAGAPQDGDSASSGALTAPGDPPGGH